MKYGSHLSFFFQLSYSVVYCFLIGIITTQVQQLFFVDCCTSFIGLQRFEGVRYIRYFLCVNFQSSLSIRYIHMHFKRYFSEVCFCYRADVFKGYNFNFKVSHRLFYTNFCKSSFIETFDNS